MQIFRSIVGLDPCFCLLLVLLISLVQKWSFKRFQINFKVLFSLPTHSSILNYSRRFCQSHILKALNNFVDDLPVNLLIISVTSYCFEQGLDEWFVKLREQDLLENCHWFICNHLGLLILQVVPIKIVKHFVDRVCKQLEVIPPKSIFCQQILVTISFQFTNQSLFAEVSHQVFWPCMHLRRIIFQITFIFNCIIGCCEG